MFAFAMLTEIELSALARVTAGLIDASSIVQTRIADLARAFIDIVFTSLALPLLSAQAFRLSIRQALAGAIVLTVQTGAEIILTQ